MKVLFLYTELADYFVACVKYLVQRNEIEAHIVRWPVKAEAPFQFQFPKEVQVYERNELNDDTLIRLVEEVSPSVIVASGWMDKGYVKVCKKYKEMIPVIGAMDNHWQGSLKQHLACFLSPFTIKQYFSFLWVPGTPQEEYARKLGFSQDQILTGYYSADFKKFDCIFQQIVEKKKEVFPKRFIYVGRYIEHKGIFDLWNAFTELQEEDSNEWELWCLGTGAEWENRVIHPKIKHLGFVQPKDMQHYLSETGVFVLPSHFEPWGVVVHEMAAAGFPLLCSSKVGAASKFLQEGQNGFLFNVAEKDALKKVMSRVMQYSDGELIQMGIVSNQLAKQVTPEIWSTTLMNIISAVYTGSKRD